MTTTSFEDKMNSVKRAGGYDPGDIFTVELKDIDEAVHEITFQVEAYCLGGFGGQVYRAKCTSSKDGFLREGESYAVKIYQPRSLFRRLFRNITYWIGFQSPFPYHYDENAARSVLYVSEILKEVCKVEFGTTLPINECYGVFWNDHVGAFGEVNEWVFGGVSDPVVDRDKLIRWAKNREIKKLISKGKAKEEDLIHPTDEITKKHVFMDRLVELCYELGFEDTARQVYWWTGASQPNILTRRPSRRHDGSPDFVWVDRRPGLPGFIASLGDFVLLTMAILRGSIPPFDKINFKKLRAWPKAPDQEKWNRLVDRLEQLDRPYRDGQLDIFSHNIRLLYDFKLLRSIRESRLNCWRKSNRIDDKTHEALNKNLPLLLFHIILVLIPFIGSRLQKFLSNAKWRKCIIDFIFNGKYRNKIINEARVYRIKIWLNEDRTTPERARICYYHMISFLKDLFFYFWMPSSWQMFFTDQAFQWDMLRRLFTSPFRYIFITSYRSMVNTNWIKAQTLEDVRRGYVSQEQADRFIAIAGDKPLQQYITGIMYTAAVKPVSEFSYIIGFIAFISRIIEALKSLGPALAVLAAFLLLLISPAGVLRFLYSVVMGIFNPRVPYWAAIICAPIRGLGDLAFPIQMSVTYPSFASYLLTSSILKLVEHVPVFGERGGLLAIITVSAFLSWPASFKAYLQYLKNDGKNKTPECRKVREDAETISDRKEVGIIGKT